MAKGIDPIRLIASILLSRALALPALPVHADPGVNRDLFEAARRGNASEVKAALAAGTDPGALDEYGATPLHWAAAFNPNPSVISNPSVITALIEGGADPSARDDDGKVPFDCAKDNEALKGTEAYWLLNEARFE